jgi:hypothetical protein
MPMLKLLTILAVFLLGWAISLPADAASCYQINGDRLCLEQIKRSAKNYWEYRIVTSVNGVQQPQEIYNCRSRTKIKSDRTMVDFQPYGFGEFICRKFKR